MEKKFVYQLKAKGNSAVFNNKFEVSTSTVFSSEDLAEKRIPKFRKMCLDSSRFEYAEEKGLEISIVPLEIVE